MSTSAPDPKYRSIQVAATRQDTDGFTVVGEAGHPTHYSVYLRTLEGFAEHVSDFRRRSHTGAMARSSALLAAAKLSMEHFIPIERLL